jgi:hypothetical protein
MADVAVCCEPFSASNSLIIRENSGNYAISGTFEVGEAKKTPHPACAFSRNSLEIGTGNFKQVTGNQYSLIGV